MLNSTVLRAEFERRVAAVKGIEPSPLLCDRGGFTPFGEALVLMGLLANSAAPWATLYTADGNTLRLRYAMASVPLAKPRTTEDGVVRTELRPTGSLVVELLEGRANGYGIGLKVLRQVRINAETRPANALARIEGFISSCRVLASA
jgi:hypothetical protein